MPRKKIQKPSAKRPIMALSQVEEKELTIDADTLSKLENILAKNGGVKSGLTLSDIVTHFLFEKPASGFKFKPQKNEPVSLKLSMPKAAWDVAEKSAKKSGDVGLPEVIKALVKED